VVRTFFKKLAFTLLPETLYSLLVIVYWRVRNQKGRVYEKEIPILKEFVSSGDHVVDIGVNFCQYTSRLTELVGTTGRVIGFEAHPFAYSIARKLARKDECVEIHNLAVSDQVGTVRIAVQQFNRGVPNWGTVAVLETTSPNAQGIQVESTTLDHFLHDRSNRVAFVKCDIEGHELFAFAGGRQLLSKDQPVVLVETSSWNYPILSAFFAEFEYSPFEVSEKGDILPVGPHESETFNVLYLPLGKATKWSQRSFVV
jgi:FkbM family methyltransferase